MRKRFKRSGKFCVYIVRCRDGTYYTGYTSDLKNRLRLHNTGKGAKYTRDRRPVKLVWYKEYRHFKRAFKKELALKKLNHAQKKGLITKFKKKKVGHP